MVHLERTLSIDVILFTLLILQMRKLRLKESNYCQSKKIQPCFILPCNFLFITSSAGTLQLGTPFLPQSKQKIHLKTALLIIQRATLKNHLKISKQSLSQHSLSRNTLVLNTYQALFHGIEKQIASGPLMVQIVSSFDYTLSFQPFNLVDLNISYPYNGCDSHLAILIQSLTVYIKCYSINNYLVYLPANPPGYLLEQYC